MIRFAIMQTDDGILIKPAGNLTGDRSMAIESALAKQLNLMSIAGRANGIKVWMDLRRLRYISAGGIELVRDLRALVEAYGGRFEITPASRSMSESIQAPPEEPETSVAAVMPEDAQGGAAPSKITGLFYYRAGRNSAQAFMCSMDKAPA